MTKSRGTRPYRRLFKDVDDRFWSKVRIGDGCWEWTAARDEKGYGKFGKQPTQRAHRVSWEMEKGPIPEGMSVLHRCDNRRCIRPGHLFLGTQTDNMADMNAKGRHGAMSLPGSKNPKSILTEDVVRDLRARRAAGAKCSELARELGVCRATVSHAVNGRNWGHVEVQR